MEPAQLGLILGASGLLFTTLICALLAAVIWRVYGAAHWTLFASLPLSGMLIAPLVGAVFDRVFPTALGLIPASVYLSGVVSGICLLVPLWVIWRGLPSRLGG